MPFAKGHPSYWTEETRQKVREKFKGRIGYWAGKKMPETMRKNLSLSRMGHQVSKETRMKISLANKGKRRTDEAKKKISDALLGKIPWNKGLKGFLGGEKHYNWKGGLPYRLNMRRAYRLKNKIKVNFWHRGFRAKAKGAVGSHTFEEWESLRKQYNYSCLSCFRKEPDIILCGDHIVPLSKGGSDFISNIQPLCVDCNRKKQARTIRFTLQNFLFPAA